MINIALLKLCRCGKKIEYHEKYCDTCSVEYEQEQKQRHIDYKNNRQDAKEQAFYNTKEWLKTRGYILSEYKGLCLYSLFILNQIIFSDCIHHIVEIKDDWSKRLEVDNLIPLSDEAHAIVHAMYKKDKVKAQLMLRELINRWNREYGNTDNP